MTAEDRFAAVVRLHGPGDVQHVEVRYGSGHPTNPMTADQLTDKQRRAMRRVIGIDGTDHVIALLNELDTVGDLGEATDPVRNGSAGTPEEPIHD